MTVRPAALAVVLAAGPAASAFAELPASVLIVSGEARNLPGNRILFDSIQAAMRRESAKAIEFYIETIDLARFGGGPYETRLTQLYAEKYGQVRLDLVIAFTEPAVDFVLRHRAEMFPDAPLLLGLVERRLVPRAVPPNGSGWPRRTVAAASQRFRRSSPGMPRAASAAANPSRSSTVTYSAGGWKTDSLGCSRKSTRTPPRWEPPKVKSPWRMLRRTPSAVIASQGPSIDQRTMFDTGVVQPNRPKRATRSSPRSTYELSGRTPKSRRRIQA